MADPQQQQQDEDLIISFFPDPPPFWKHFTTENQGRLKVIEDEAANGDEAAAKRASGATSSLSAEQILALPTELRYLIPPEPPAEDEEFYVFNEKAKAKGTDVFEKKMEYISAMLKVEGIFEEWTYEQLYPSASSADASQPPSASATLDRQNYLFRFLRSILLSYVALLGIVASNPTSPQANEKLKDIMTMVANMHALINEYRPHQARETLIDKMEEQVERKKREIEGVKQVAERVKGVLGGFGKETEGLHKSEDSKTEVGAAIQDEQAKQRGVQRYMWEAMDEILEH